MSNNHLLAGKTSRAAVLAVLISVVALLSGCGAPSLTIAGAYFPAWLLCAILGLVAAIVARGIMVVTRLAEVIPYQLIVCLALGLAAGFLVWRRWVAH